MIGVSSKVLVAVQPLGERLPPNRVSNALAKGLEDHRRFTAEIVELGEGLDALHLAALDFDAKMKACRAVVIVARRLDEHTLLASIPFEIATKARQAGVPCYAITKENALNRFDARILDLQVVIEARSEESLRAAGHELAKAM